MSLSLRETVARSTTLRLNLWYAAIFVLSATVLFALLYLLLSSALQRKDREIIETRLKACAAIYQDGGLAGLQDFVQRSSEAERAHSFFVRLASPSQTALLLNLPEDWVHFDVSALQPGGDPSKLMWLLIPKNEDFDLTVAFQKLPDGSVLEVGRSTSNRESVLQPFRLNFLEIMTPTLVLGVLGGALFAHRATRPVREVVATARAIIDKGDSSARVSVSDQQNEMQDLALQFNRVLDKNESLIRGMREALDNVAHDLRTPLTRIHSTVEAALQVTEDPIAREALADCVEESDRVLTMLSALMDITEAESGMMALKLQRMSMGTLLVSVVDLYQLVADEKRIELKLEIREPCEVSVDGIRMRQALANLLDNALKYTPEGGSVRLRCFRQDRHTYVQIQDNGMGISNAEQPRIWGRLYRGDKSRSQRGLGLGLSLVKAIIEAHHGEVHVRSNPGEGSTFEVELPA